MKRNRHFGLKATWGNILFLLLVFGFCVSQKVNAKNISELYSPDKNIRIQLSIDKSIQISVFYRNELLFDLNNIKLVESDQSSVFSGNKMLKTKLAYIENDHFPIVKTKSAIIEEKCNQLVIIFRNFNFECRAYNEGIAYRFIGKSDENIILMNENLDVEFNDCALIYFPEEESMFSHNERLYRKDSLVSIKNGEFCSLPMLAVTKKINVLISESSLHNYPGMWLEKSKSNTLSAIFPNYPKEVQLIHDRNEKVIATEPYIAQCNAQRSFPWRVFPIAEDDAELLTNQLVWLLSEENVITETDWIRPGKVAWDWWNANNIYGVDFEAGINTETYKYYIDFASSYGLEYVILDEGWYKLGNLLDVAPEIDMEELVTYASRKNVGIILWVIWKTLEEQLNEALNQFEKWGVKGIKVDFMQRDDQWMVNYYEKIALEAARHKLLVDFHGNYKPAGLHRKYPNVLTREGVRGLEHYKWNDLITPDHNLTLPFIRMVVGPMDYTPGAMKNAAKGNHAIIYNSPMSLGTRVHQMAMYVVFESPLQMLADNPSNYIREPEIMEFLSPVPTVWDKTEILKARIGDYIINARKSGDEWYIGAMNDWTEREFDVQLDFLEEGKTYRAIIFKDGKNAHRFGSDYKKEILEVNSESNMKIKMAPGGGWVARIIAN